MMTVPVGFDPFRNRLCRNARNALSERFVKALAQNEMQPVMAVADAFLKSSLPDPVRAYIEQRLQAYRQVMADIRANALEDPLQIAIALWDRQLFFETHEYLEPHWMRAVGAERRFFQAVIRAAGTYVHLQQGNRVGARRIADKARAVLEKEKSRLMPFADVQLLLDKLETLDPAPPRLMRPSNGAPLTDVPGPD